MEYRRPGLAKISGIKMNVLGGLSAIGSALSTGGNIKPVVNKGSKYGFSSKVRSFTKPTKLPSPVAKTGVMTIK